MLNIRRAESHEFELLNDLMIKSESYWNLGPDYLKKIKDLFSVTGEFIRENPTYILEEEGYAIGFYGVLVKDNETSLEYFFLEPQSIGKGYGKILWNHMIEECRKMKIKEIVIITSPLAEGFYTKMGAKVIGQLECQLIDGRKIPKLIYVVES